jgi:hypothetical protein
MLMRCALAALCAAAVALFPACGGDEQASDDQTTASSVPAATESVDDFAARLTDAADAAAAGDCDTIDEFNDEAGVMLPCDSGGAGYDDFEVTATDDFGTAGFVDFTDKQAPDGATAIAAINEDGRFRLVQSLIPSSLGLESEQVGTEPEETTIRDQAVADFVTAVREGDCDTYFQLGLTPTQDKEKECRIEFSDRTGIKSDLEANPDATASLLGESEAFAVYGLETADTYRVVLSLRNYAAGDKATADDGYRIVTYRAQD